MIKEEEYVVFINEIGCLLKDYENCSSQEIKELIEKDIVLLGRVIQL